MRQVTPVHRYTSALLVAERLRLALFEYTETHNGEIPTNIIQILSKREPKSVSKMAFSFANPFSPKDIIHYVNVQNTTSGAIVLAANSSIRNPYTKKLIRLIIRATDASLTMAESEFQSLSKANFTLDKTELKP